MFRNTHRFRVQLLGFIAKNAMARVAAELYDAEYIPPMGMALLAWLFYDYDPNLYLLRAGPRPSTLERIGALEYDHGRYASVPKEWLETPESSLLLLSPYMLDGRIVLGEWTQLRRLEEEWPMEERMSLIRASDLVDSSDTTATLPRGGVLFASTRGIRIDEVNNSDHRKLADFPDRELIIAHDGHRFHLSAANWLAFSPYIGVDMGWKLSEQGRFCWIDRDDKVVVESLWWQDGPFESYSLYDHVEVGCGWLVLITEKGYAELQQRFGGLVRYGAVRRSLGQFGSTGYGSIVSRI